MNNAELIARFAEDTGLTKAAAKDAVENLFKIISTEMVAGNEVAVSGFGKFTVVDRAARTARNPHTGESIEVPASRAPKFKASTTLKSQF